MILAQQLRPLVRPLRAYYIPFRIMASLSADYRRRVVTRASDLVIEGSPRSGNTFLQLYVALANEQRGLRIAHHTHAPGQLRGAVMMGLPTIVTVRDPENAVSSLCVRSPQLAPEQALRDYIQFQSALLDLTEHVVIVGFEMVTEAPDQAVQRLNDRFGLDLATPKLDASLRARVFARIDQENEVYGGGASTATARPDESKQERKHRVLSALRSDRRCRKLLARAVGVHNLIANVAAGRGLANQGIRNA